MQGARKGSHNYSILQGKSKRCYFTDTETGPVGAAPYLFRCRDAADIG